MSKKRILIVEDEPLIADDIAMILEQNDYHITVIVDNASDALATLDKSDVDLILLDINIEGSLDGIQLAHQINLKYKVPLVYLTSYYDNNTLKRAKLTNPAAYIVKPFDAGDLVANIELASLKAVSGSSVETTNTEKFFVRDNKELKSIDAGDIIYVESDNNYANIYTTDRKYVVSHTLKKVEENLSKKQFIRIHKSYLVNFDRITSIHEGYVFLGEIKLIIGRAYKENLLGALSIL